MTTIDPKQNVRAAFDAVMGTSTVKEDAPRDITMAHVLGQAWGETLRLTRMAVRSSKRAKLTLRVLTLAVVLLSPMAIAAPLMGLWMAWEPYCVWRKWEARRVERAKSPERTKRKGLTISIRWA